MLPSATRAIVVLAPRLLFAFRPTGPQGSLFAPRLSAAAPPSTDVPPSLSLVGCQNFVRSNPRSDRFEVEAFAHVEFICGDAKNTASRFANGFGMPIVAKSDMSTGNYEYASYVLRSHDLVFTFTAPYGDQQIPGKAFDAPPHPPLSLSREEMYPFFRSHGLAVKAVGVFVADAALAHEECITNGGISKLPPTTLGKTTMSEVSLYGDVHLRLLSGERPEGSFLPGYEPIPAGQIADTFGLARLDHCVGNVPSLLETVNYVAAMTGFHEFAEFTAEDVGTLDSGLNSMVLASNNEMVLFPINEPTHGTKRKSQIQTYLEQNEGPGVQHMALKTDDIFRTVAEMRARTAMGGFDFMPRPSEEYYRNLPERLGEGENGEAVFTAEEYARIEELGLLADKDDQGVLLQIFTQPLGDRSTCFVEIIQRMGCEIADEDGVVIGQRAGCGGFGKGNFSELFKRIEEFETENGLNDV